MKTLKTFILTVLVLFLTACGVVTETTNKVTYLADAGDFVGDVVVFSNQAPILLQTAVYDEDSRAKLETALTEMKSDIEEFNSVTPPEEFLELHSQIVSVNEKGLVMINELLPLVQNGTLTEQMVEKFNFSQVFADIQSITEQLKTLGN